MRITPPDQEPHPDTSPFTVLASRFDNRLDKGCTAILTAFINTLKQSDQKPDISLYTIIRMEPQPRLQLGSLLFGYMAVAAAW